MFHDRKNRKQIFFFKSCDAPSYSSCFKFWPLSNCFFPGQNLLKSFLHVCIPNIPNFKSVVTSHWLGTIITKLKETLQWATQNLAQDSETRCWTDFGPSPLWGPSLEPRMACTYNRSSLGLLCLVSQSVTWWNCNWLIIRGYLALDHGGGVAERFRGLIVSSENFCHCKAAEHYRCWRREESVRQVLELWYMKVRVEDMRGMWRNGGNYAMGVWCKP